MTSNNVVRLLQSILYFFLMPLRKAKPRSVVLEGHRDSVNSMRLNVDLSMLLSGGTVSFSPPFLCNN
jgi:hypothetical protein